MAEAQADPEYRGRLVEAAVGAHLANQADEAALDLFYWREGKHEVDFVLRRGDHVLAIEVKSGRRRERQPGLDAFRSAFPDARTLLVGSDGMPLEEFLLTPSADLLR